MLKKKKKKNFVACNLLKACMIFFFLSNANEDNLQNVHYAFFMEKKSHMGLDHHERVTPPPFLGELSL